MHQKITVSMLVALLAAFAIACEPRQEPGTQPEESPEAIMPGEQTERERQQEAQQPQAQPPGNGMEGERQPGDGQEGRRAEDQPTGALNASALTEEPAAFIDKQVTVEGEVAEIYGTSAFKLSDLIVLGGQGAAWQADSEWDGAKVRVTGKVQAMTGAQQLQSEIGRPLEAELREALQDQRIVLIAESVQRIDQ